MSKNTRSAGAEEVDENPEKNAVGTNGQREIVRIAIVASREQEKMVSALIRSAVGALMSQQVNESQMRVMWAPRMFQMPLLAQSMAQSKEFDGILVLGVTIKDENMDGYYFQNAEVMRGLMDVMMSSGVPVNHCLVMTDNVRDAQKIADAKGADNRAATAATELVELLTS